ncbi:MAG TPA: hypothetical protein VJL89_03115, partial [Thermodesulfovibrionia bacterium]|nr:hypothetical protein [Thermodesulfovibrionia bacterium]
MLIECSRCQARVYAKLIAEHIYPPNDYNEPHKYVFMECPSCKSILLGYSECCDYEDGWTEPYGYGKIL